MRNHFGPVILRRQSSTLATDRWRAALHCIKKSEVPFSPAFAIDVLSGFTEDYRRHTSDRDHQKQMINSPEFIELLSNSVKQIHLFNADELSRLVHLTTIGIDWRDKTLLKGTEPMMMEYIPTMSLSNVLDCAEAFSILKCGSRPFWEAIVSVISVSECDKPDLMRIIGLIEAGSSSFYKPRYVLSELFPRVLNCVKSGEMSNQDLSKVIHVYSKWSNSINSKSELEHFFQIIASKLNWSEFSTIIFAPILSGLVQHRVRADTFFEKLFASDLTKNQNPSSVSETIIGLYKCAEKYSPPMNCFVDLFACVKGLKHVPKLDQLVSIHSRLFGLVNPIYYSGINFGPINDWDYEPLLKRRLPKMHLRQIARLMLSLATVRKGSPELWASLITVFGQLVGEEGSSLSPEELSGVMFAIPEMGILVTDELKNEIIVAFLEKIHLVKSFDTALFFVSICLEPEQSTEVLKQILQLMDIETVSQSDSPSVVLANLALRCLVKDEAVPEIDEIIKETNEDVEMYFGSNWKAVEHCLNRNLLVTDGLRVDAFMSDQKIAVLVSSPIQITPDGAPTGMAILRHRALERYLPKDWRLVNISSEEGLAGVNVEDIPDLKEERKDTKAFPQTQFDPTEEPEEWDISKFLRKDRNAAHRKRAPPSDSLPWVPSVLTLKRTRGRRRMNFRS